MHRNYKSCQTARENAFWKDGKIYTKKIGLIAAKMVKWYITVS